MIISKGIQQFNSITSTSSKEKNEHLRTFRRSIGWRALDDRILIAPSAIQEISCDQWKKII